jgi:hypothetical protein
MANKNRPRRPGDRHPVSVTSAQALKPTKAIVAAVVTLAGLVGIHLTDGTAQVIVMVAQLVLVSYGVWRTVNAPKTPPAGPGVGEFL